LGYRAANPDLWQNSQAAMQIQKEQSDLQRGLDRFYSMEKRIADARALHELASLDTDIATEVNDMLLSAEDELTQFELQRLLSGPYDAYSAIVSINAGAGGTESQDWASMLLRMMGRWAEKRGFVWQMLDLQVGEESGIKSAVFSLQGSYAYGYVKGEAGVHRLVRISPFDANKRRHTSFASVGVTPEIEDDIQIEVKDEDLRVDTYRASGAGGQHVNKTDSAVRLTHLPTGIVVACQAERSQHKNRAKALKMLKSKLLERELAQREQEKEQMTGEKKKIEWGSQIRSYILHPYRLVKDHRTGCETANTTAVLDGDLDPFITAYLSGQATGVSPSPENFLEDQLD
jgi:peptide chain release factor 2